MFKDVFFEHGRIVCVFVCFVKLVSLLLIILSVLFQGIRIILFMKLTLNRIIMKKITFCLMLSGLLSFAQFPDPYCSISNASGTNGGPIINVNFGTISYSRPWTGVTSPFHQDLTAQSTVVQVGDTYTLNVLGGTNGPGRTYYWTVFFDWNRDNDFDDAGERTNLGTIFGSTQSNPQNRSFNIVIPTTASTGAIRMRLSLRHTGYMTNSCDHGFGTVGAVQDYTIIVGSENDECDTAKSLMVGTSFSDFDLINQNLNNATSSIGVPNPSCGNYQGNDIWYSFTMPSNGEITFETQTSGDDTAIALYAGSCDTTLTEIACNDNNGGLSSSRLDISDLSLANQTLFVRVWSPGNAFNPTFDIAAWSATLPMIPASSLNFDGNDDIVSLPQSFSELGSSSFTVESWVKVPTVGTGGLGATERVGIIFGNFTTAAAADSFEFEIHDDGQVRIFWNNGAINIFGTQDLRDNSWHHIACVRNIDDNTFKIYIDGVEELSTTAGINLALNNLFFIGGDGRLASGPNFHGNIDDLRVWNVSKTQTEISQSMNCELTGFEPNLLAYYNFNQGLIDFVNTTETSLIDSSSNNNNGTLQNFALVASASNWSGASSVASGFFCPLPLPEGINQAFCGSPTVADLSANGFGTFNFYNSDISPTPLAPSETLVTGTYYVSQSALGLESLRTAFEVTVVSSFEVAPIASNQDFCGSVTVGELNATGSGLGMLSWFDAPSGGTLLDSSFNVVSNTTLYVAETLNSCESPRTAVNININPLPQLPLTSNQGRCGSNTIGDLFVFDPTGTATYLWYDVAIGGTALASTTPVITNNTYYVAETNGFCEGPRRAIVYTEYPVPTEVENVPSSDSFCTNNGTVSISFLQSAYFNGIGSNNWYFDETSTTPIDGLTSISSGTYFASRISDEGCESIVRKEVVLTMIDNPDAPVVISPVIYGLNEIAVPLTAVAPPGVILEWEDEDLFYGTTAPTPDTSQIGTTYYYVYGSIDGCYGPDSEIEVIVNGTLGTHDITDNMFLTLLPNPVKDIMTMDANFEIQSIEVFNIIGQSVMQVNTPSSTYNLDVSILKSGTYIIRANLDVGTITKKFIKL